jgi:hypothetical protein
MKKPEAVPGAKPELPPAEAREHIAEAHRLLTALRGRLDRHPELEEAIEKLEMAMSALTLKSGGML